MALLENVILLVMSFLCWCASSLTDAQRVSCPALFPIARTPSEADLYVGGFFDVHAGSSASGCGNQLNRDAVAEVEALFWAVTNFKQRYSTAKLLHNVTLGAFAIDTCSNRQVALSRLRNFENCPASFEEPRILPSRTVSYLGPNSVQVATGITGELNSLFRKNNMLYGTIQPASAETQRFTFYNAPTLSLQAKMLIDVLKVRSWKHIQLVVGAEEWYQIAGKDFEETAKNADVCIVAASNFIANEPASLGASRIIETLLARKEVRAVLLLTSPEETQALLQGITDFKVGGVFSWFGTTLMTNKTLMTGVERSARGAITLRLDPLDPINALDFQARFVRKRPDSQTTAQNPWFREFWEQRFQCALPSDDVTKSKFTKPCTGTERLSYSDMKVTTEISHLIRAVDQVFLGVSEALNDVCGSQSYCTALADDLLRQGRLVNAKISDLEMAGRRQFDEDTHEPLVTKVSVMNYRLDGSCPNGCFRKIGSIRSGMISAIPASEIHVYGQQNRILDEVKSECKTSCEVCQPTTTTTTSTTTTSPATSTTTASTTSTTSATTTTSTTAASPPSLVTATSSTTASSITMENVPQRSASSAQPSLTSSLSTTMTTTPIRVPSLVVDARLTATPIATRSSSTVPTSTASTIPLFAQTSASSTKPSTSRSTHHTQSPQSASVSPAVGVPAAAGTSPPTARTRSTSRQTSRVTTSSSTTRSTTVTPVTPVYTLYPPRGVVKTPRALPTPYDQFAITSTTYQAAPTSSATKEAVAKETEPSPPPTPHRDDQEPPSSVSASRTVRSTLLSSQAQTTPSTAASTSSSTEVTPTNISSVVSVATTSASKEPVPGRLRNNETEPPVRLRRGTWIVPVMILAGLGVLLTLAFEGYILVTLSGTGYLRSASATWLGHMLLFSLFLAYALLFAFAPEPNRYSCGVIRFGLGNVYALIFSCLLVKCLILINRKQKNFIGCCHQFTLFFFIWLVQVAIDVMWLLLRPPRAIPIGDSGDWRCETSFLEHFRTLSYVMFLIAIVSIVAIRTIGAPYREGILIQLSTLVSVFLWIAWALVAFITDDINYWDPCLAFGLFAIATVVLFMIFVGKLRQLAVMEVERTLFAASLAASHDGSFYSPTAETSAAGSISNKHGKALQVVTYKKNPLNGTNMPNGTLRSMESPGGNSKRAYRYATISGGHIPRVYEAAPTIFSPASGPPYANGPAYAPVISAHPNHATTLHVGGGAPSNPRAHLGAAQHRLGDTSASNQNRSGPRRTSSLQEIPIPSSKPPGQIQRTRMLRVSRDLTGKRLPRENGQTQEEEDFGPGIPRQTRYEPQVVVRNYPSAEVQRHYSTASPDFELY